ncbi:MAG: efflux RND transporter periplasmic adaptor subunit [Polyangiaceae bacterium]|nr:efflux RND transporter periplasmic adaptor subunit [Polyangiaceae bacterium]
MSALVVLPCAALVVLATAISGCREAPRREPVAAAGGASAPPSAPAPPPPGPPIQVEVLVVKLEAVQATLAASGTLAAAESVSVVSELPRRLARVHVKDGQRVKKGELLFTLDTADASAQLARVRVRTRAARAQLERGKKLVEEGLLSAQELERLQASVDELEAEQRVLGVTLGKSRIRAPFAGVLGLRQVSEGAWVTPERPLVALHDLSHLRLDFTLPERWAGAVRPGQVVRFQVAGSAVAREARVTAIEPEIDPTTRSLRVRATAEHDGGLLPGGFASVELTLTSPAPSVFVPSLAVVPSAAGDSVWIVEGGEVQPRPVRLGRREPERVEITSGVAEGESLVVGNLLRLRPGAAVVVAARGAQP